MTGSPQSFGERLVAELDDIESGLQGLLDISKIRYTNWSNDEIVFVAPNYSWEASDDAQTLARIALKERFSPWRERVAMLEGRATKEIRKELTESLKLVGSWIDRDGSGWEIPRSIPEAKVRVATEVDRARTALRLLSSTGGGGMHVVPDTSALMRQPDLATYGSAVNADVAVIHLVPTVLGEIDNLKDQGRTPEVRERASKLATRIKGLRDRGKLTQGVPVAGSVTAIADPRDPSFEHLPTWLDPSTPDDRILASALALQAANPGAVVVLVAVDINIQNKAEACGLPYCEPVDP